MSIKLYEAFRVPISKFEDALSFFETEYFNICKKLLLESVAKISDEDANSFILKYRNFYKEPEFLLHGSERSNLASAKLIIVLSVLMLSSKKEYSLNNSDCRVTFYITKRFIYFWSIGPNSFNSGIEKFPEYFQNYSYWNNTDKPSEITRRKWDNRGKKWSELSKSKNICTYYFFRAYDGVFKNSNFFWRLMDDISGESNSLFIYFTAKHLVDNPMSSDPS